MLNNNTQMKEESSYADGMSKKRKKDKEAGKGATIFHVSRYRFTPSLVKQRKRMQHDSRLDMVQ